MTIDFISRWIEKRSTFDFLASVDVDRFDNPYTASFLAPRVYIARVLHRLLWIRSM